MTGWRRCIVVVFAVGVALTACAGPPNVDEVDAFEARIGAVMPAGWTMDYEVFVALPHAAGTSTPHIDPWDRAFVLSAPWPGGGAKRVQVLLFLHGSPPGALGPEHEVLGTWERFTVVAQDPALVALNNQSFGWNALPGWTTAKQDLAAALRR